MKKGIVIGIALMLVLGAAPAKKYWQDVLLQQGQEWKEAFGHDMPETQKFLSAADDVFYRLTENDCILARNINTLLVEAQAVNAKLVDMQAEIDELKRIIDANDPNE
jgi:peptidoglycan hydrolase CwlO-like protein